MLKRYLLLLVFLGPVILTAQSLDEKIGQMLMTGFPNEGAGRDSLNEDIAAGRLGNLLLFGSNIDSPGQLRTLIEELQWTSADGRMFIAVDQEGGRVARLNASNGYLNTRDAAFIGRFRNNESGAKAEAERMAIWLQEAGINFNLAPVADVNINPNSPVIGGLNRSYSSNENVVYQHVKWATEVYHEYGIATSLKHFPGHGSSLQDSHLGFTDITNTWEDRELTPYRLLIEAGYKDAIMSGHLFKGDWDDTYPASISKVAITDMLRDSLGFEGVVISDELFMRAIKDNFSFEEAVIQAVNSGTDILLYSINTFVPEGESERVSLPKTVIRIIKEAIAAGTIDEALIDAAYARIQELKARRIDGVTNIDEGFDELPTSFEMSAYPNPFNPTTTIELELQSATQLQLDVYNINGQRMASLHQGAIQSGSHFFPLNAMNWPSGVYLVRAVYNGQSSLQKITLLK